eukprot:COSAG03_NODE_12550_length_542_cov_0.957111_1_plen_47_part_01
MSDYSPLKLGTDALKHPLSIFEGRLQSITCVSQVAKATGHVDLADLD